MIVFISEKNTRNDPILEKGLNKFVFMPNSAYWENNTTYLQSIASSFVFSKAIHFGV